MTLFDLTYLKYPGITSKSAEGYQYFLPSSLYNALPLDIPVRVLKRLESAGLALGEFSSLIEKIPNVANFIQVYNREEARVSSLIEGTQIEIEEAFKSEDLVSSEKCDDWAEVDAYTRAMQQAVDSLQELPLCNRLIKDTHRTLLSQIRGSTKSPGEFRRGQSWIGGNSPGNADFVPPSHEYINGLMSDLEKFIQDDDLDLPELIKVALIHYQFETIHPFLDGNGRMGRMLIPLYLFEKKILKYPMLYISRFLKSHRSYYYKTLNQGRRGKEGVVQWVSFFLDAVEHTSKLGIEVTQKFIEYDAELRQKKILQLGRRADKGLILLEYLYKRPFISAKLIQEKLGFNPVFSQRIISDFVELEILFELTGNKRNRLFGFLSYLSLLEGEEYAYKTS